MLEAALKDFIHQTVLEVIAGHSGEPEYISVEQAAKLADNVDRSVIDALVHGAPSNGFPVAKLGPRTYKINKAKMIQWIDAGGLDGIGKNDR